MTDNENIELEKLQQLKYYFTKLYSQVFFDEETGEMYHSKLQDQRIELIETDSYE